MVAVGTRLGPYEILSQLGAGGMGEVYRAKDLRLNRTVAIKVLTAQVSDRADQRGSPASIQGRQAPGGLVVGWPVHHL
jgi:serine/threonine protein kinase